MGIIFGKKKPPSRITQHDKAVLQMKQQRDKLKQYQKRIELTLLSDRELAKKLLINGQRERAKLLLKKKRFQEQILQKTDNQLDNLERVTHDLEFAQIELQVVDGLREGNEALKKINETLNISDIEKILDETREGVEKQEEINALLGGALTDEDNVAVEEELEELLSEQMPSVPTEELEGEPDVPVSPKREKTKERRKEERIALEA